MDTALFGCLHKPSLSGLLRAIIGLVIFHITIGPPLLIGYINLLSAPSPDVKSPQRHAYTFWLTAGIFFHTKQPVGYLVSFFIGPLSYKLTGPCIGTSEVVNSLFSLGHMNCYHLCIVRHSGCTG